MMMVQKSRNLPTPQHIDILTYIHSFFAIAFQLETAPIHQALCGSSFDSRLFVACVFLVLPSQMAYKHSKSHACYCLEITKKNEKWHVVIKAYRRCLEDYNFCNELNSDQREIML
ncbi:CLUMA_CG013931, isoform A [Clunio marinus]|uniref:CLUMA_CG013931, isoform A n=1 Tax=Clunio marinus TaxID=568069 RepID=A0A1J1IKA6_9DIPT|nr:CLUMA_CG013931, isoform A [Clunio marinus]